MKKQKRTLKQWRSSIQLKISLILIVMTTLMLSGFAVYQYVGLKSQKLAELTALAEVVKERLAENLAAPMWNFDEALMEKMLVSEMRERDLLAILIKDAWGKLLLGKTRDAEWEIVDAKDRFLSDTLTARTEVIRNEAVIGSVELYLTQKFMRAELYRELWIIAVVVVGLNLAILFVLNMTLRYLFSRPIALLLRQADAIADGDLTQKVALRKRDEIGRLAYAYQKMCIRLNEVTANVKAAADNIASSSQQMSSNAEEMSQGASEQAATAEEVSSSMEEMSANVRQNTDNAIQTEKIALQAASHAGVSGQAVAEAVEAMQQIAGKIAIIDDIARQTRLLSLNATIEAARAQEYGKGFAVVAAEVRALSERSQEAAADITELAHSGVTVAEKAGEMLAQLVPDIQRTAELVQEISAASNEQNQGVEQINRAIQQLDSVIQQNSLNAEQSASMAEHLAKQAEYLQHIMAFFKTGTAELDIPDDERGIDEGVSQMSRLQDTRGAGKEKRGNRVMVEPQVALKYADIERDRGNSSRQAAHSGIESLYSDKSDTLDDEFERY